MSIRRRLSKRRAPCWAAEATRLDPVSPARYKPPNIAALSARVREGTMFDVLGRVAANHPGKVLFLWIVAAVLLTRAAPDWERQAQDDDIRFLPADAASVRAYQLLEKTFPKDVCASRAILAIERDDGPLTRSDFALVDRLVVKLNRLKDSEPKLQITGVASYRDGPVGKRLTSNDGRCTLVPLSLATPYLAAQTRETVDRAEAELRPIVE